jgi:hypothetical protein
MKSSFALAAVVGGLFVVGGAGAWVYLRLSRPSGAPADAASATAVRQDADEHGRAIDIPDDPVLCTKHGVPEVVCPFCDPSLVETLGWCKGHDVAEALCTRCNPVLIAAFKAEGDWCAEHGLPESQCLICSGTGGG